MVVTHDGDRARRIHEINAGIDMDSRGDRFLGIDVCVDEAGDCRRAGSAWC